MCDENLLTLHRDFLLAAIEDAQAVIRAIDTKIGMLLAILILPLAKFGPALSGIMRAAGGMGPLERMRLVILAALTVTAWLLALVMAARGLIGIRGESLKSVKADGVRGLFLMRREFSGLACLLNVSPKVRDDELSCIDGAKAFCQRLPGNVTEIVGELAYEHLKVARIRDLKMIRHRAAFILAGIGIGCAVVTWTVIVRAQASVSC